MGEHIVRLDDPRFIPLARSRIAAIRQSGLRFGSQKFMVDGVTITVHVKGEQDYIRVEGGGGGEYVVWPRSFEHPSGYGSTSTALATIGANGGVNFGLAYTRVGGVLDWVSDDGYGRYGEHYVTWSSGLNGRYNPRTYRTYGGEASTYIWVDGVRIDVGMTPYGACRVEVKLAESIAIYLVFAAYPSPKELSLYRVNLSSVPSNGYAPECIATHQVPGDGTTGAGDGFQYIQPVYFGGSAVDGKIVFATLAASFLSGTQPAEYIYATQHYKVSGELVIFSDGSAVVTFVDAALSASSVSSADMGATVTFSNVEHLGVDVKPTNDIVVITMVRTSVSHAPTMALGGTVSGYGHYGYTEVSESMTVGSEVIYSFRSVSSKHVETATASGDIYAGEPRVISYTRTDEGRTSNTFVVHDLDGRYGAYAFTKFTLVQGTTSYSGVFTSLPDGTYTNFLSPISGDSDLHVVITYGVKPLGGSVVEDPYFSGLAADIDIGPFLTYSGLIVSSRRMATRRNGSFVASTSVYASREVESVYAGYTGLLPNRTMNVVVYGRKIKKSTGWPDKKKLGLPGADTEPTLFPIHLAP